MRTLCVLLCNVINYDFIAVVTFGCMGSLFDVSTIFHLILCMYVCTYCTYKPYHLVLYTVVRILKLQTLPIAFTTLNMSLLSKHIVSPYSCLTYTLITDVKYGRMDTAYGVSGVHSLMILLEEPRMELSLRKCRPLVASVGHTAMVCVCVCVCVCVFVCVCTCLDVQTSCHDCLSLVDVCESFHKLSTIH